MSKNDKKPKKVPETPKEFRVSLVHIDGHLLANYKSDRSHYFRKSYYSNKEHFDTSTAEMLLKCHCKEKGCVLISYSWTDDGVIGRVRWPSLRD